MILEQIDLVDIEKAAIGARQQPRSEEHTSELHHGYISYAVFCLKKKKSADNDDRSPQARPRLRLSAPPRAHQSVRHRARALAPCRSRRDPVSPRSAACLRPPTCPR